MHQPLSRLIDSGALPPEERGRSFAPIRVLVIEDSEADILLCREYLHDVPGLEIQAIRQLADLAGVAEWPDVVLLDLNLPDSTGLATLDACQAVCTRPIIVLSGDRDENIGYRAVERGAEDFLQKDRLSHAILARILHRELCRHRALSAFAGHEDALFQLRDTLRTTAMAL